MPEQSPRPVQDAAQVRLEGVTKRFGTVVAVDGVTLDIPAGKLVTLYDKQGQPFGSGLYNPKARVPSRAFHHGREAVGEEYFATLLDRAVDLRLNILRLPECTEAFRVVHSDGDGLSGLAVDRYADVLSVEVHSGGQPHYWYIISAE